MLEELKAKSFKRTMKGVIGCVVILVVIGILAWVMGLKCLVGGKADLNALSDSEISEIKEQYVEGEIYGIMDYYAYTTEDSKMVEREYIIPVGEESYIGLVASNKYMEKCDDIMNATQKYMMQESDEVPSTLVVKGTILPMEADSLKYYKEYYEDLDWGNEEEIFLPYYLKIDYIGDAHVSFYLLLGIMAVVVLAIAIWTFVKNATGGNQKMIIQYCKKSGNYDAAMSKLDSFYHMTRPVCGIRISPEYFLTPFGNGNLFLETKEILWAYQVTTTHRTNGIKTGTTYSLMLRLRKGKKYQISLASEGEVLQVLQHMENTVPFIIIGFTDELQKLYNRNRQEMIAESDRRIAKMQENQDIQQDPWGYTN